MDSGLETAILAALPADMDHRISFSALMDGLRLKVGVVVSYLEISDLLDDLVAAGRVACWEFEDDGWKTYSLPQPAEPDPWESEIAALEARALAAEAERDRLRAAVRAALDVVADAATVRGVAVEVAIAGALTGDDLVAIRS